MIPRNWWNLSNVDQAKQIETATLFLKDVYNILNKGIILTDNFRGALLSVTFTALNSNTAVSHQLPFAPQNYFIVGLSADMRIYDGATINNGSFVNFRCAGTTGSARIFVF